MSLSMPGIGSTLSVESAKMSATSQTVRLSGRDTDNSHAIFAQEVTVSCSQPDTSQTGSNKVISLYHTTRSESTAVLFLVGVDVD